MKQLVLVAGWVLACGAVWAQADTMSGFERMLENRGRLISRQFEDVGSAQGVSVRILHVEYLDTHERTSGIQLLINEHQSSNLAYLDKSELPGLCQALRLMELKAGEPPVENYELKFVCFFSDVEVGLFVNNALRWEYYLEVGRIREADVFLSPPKMAPILDFLYEANRRLGGS